MWSLAIPPPVVAAAGRLLSARLPLVSTMTGMELGKQYASSKMFALGGLTVE